MTLLIADDPALDAADDANPAYAARLGIVPAGSGLRALAFAIDAAIWTALASPAVVGALMLAAGDASIVPVILVVAGAALPAVFALVQLITHGRRGVTTGKAALRLRSISASTLGAPGFWRVVLRALVLWASGIVPIVGPALMFASGLWDPERRGRSILDRVGGCWVIDARAGLDPFDAKALRHARRAARGRPDESEELPSMATGADARTALRIPDARSRAGVVGPGSTGAQWQRKDDTGEAILIAQVPGQGTAAPTFAPAVAPAAVPATAPAPPVARAASPVAAPAPAPAEATAHAPAESSAPAPAEVIQAAGAVPPGGSRRAQAMVRFDDGSVVRVPVLGLIGRDPEPAPGEHVDALVRLDDPQRLLSKTHAAFGQDADGVWVADRGSRNGTQLVSPGGDVVDAGARAVVPMGWSVHVGGRSFELVARGADS